MISNVFHVLKRLRSTYFLANSFGPPLYPLAFIMRIYLRFIFISFHAATYYISLTSFRHVISHPTISHRSQFILFNNE